MYVITATDDNGFVCVDSTEVFFNALPVVSAGLDQDFVWGKCIAKCKWSPKLFME